MPNVSDMGTRKCYLFIN